MKRINLHSKFISPKELRNYALKKAGEEWKKKRMKAICYGIINIPARIINHSRELVIQLPKGHPSFNLLNNARARIIELGCVPVG